jgi:hypothetical protein
VVSKQSVCHTSRNRQMQFSCTYQISAGYACEGLTGEVLFTPGRQLASKSSDSSVLHVRPFVPNLYRR